MFLVTPSNRVLIIIQSSCCHVILVQYVQNVLWYVTMGTSILTMQAKVKNQPENQTVPMNR